MLNIVFMFAFVAHFLKKMNVVLADFEVKDVLVQNDGLEQESFQTQLCWAGKALRFHIFI